MSTTYHYFLLTFGNRRVLVSAERDGSEANGWWQQMHEWGEDPWQLSTKDVLTNALLEQAYDLATTDSAETLSEREQNRLGLHAHLDVCALDMTAWLERERANSPTNLRAHG